MQSTTLAKFMRSAQLTDAEFAKRFNLSEAYVSRLRRGLRKPSAALAQEIHEKTGLSLSCLLFPTPESRKRRKKKENSQ